MRASESTTNIGNCIVETSVPGLEEGTSYSIKVRAVVGGNLGQQPIVASQAATFGQGKGWSLWWYMLDSCAYHSNIFFQFHEKYFSVV